MKNRYRLLVLLAVTFVASSLSSCVFPAPGGYYTFPSLGGNYGYGGYGYGYRPSFFNTGFGGYGGYGGFPQQHYIQTGVGNGGYHGGGFNGGGFNGGGFGGHSGGFGGHGGGHHH